MKINGFTGAMILIGSMGAAAGVGVCTKNLRQQEIYAENLKRAALVNGIIDSASADKSSDSLRLRPNSEKISFWLGKLRKR